MKSDLVQGKYAKPFLVLVAILAISPSLAWYQARMLDGSDDQWGLLALLTAILIVFYKGSIKQKACMTKTRFSVSFIHLNLCLGLYLIGQLLSFYALFQALIAAIFIWLVIMRITIPKKPNFGLLGLLILSLPLFASLDFYCGYPLRYLLGLVSSFLLQLQGLAVHLQGVQLVLNDQIIMIDAPCSGIKMMWMASYIVCCFVAINDLTFKQALKLSLTTFLLVLLANVMRVSALFYVESGLIPDLQAYHQSIGMVCYVMAVCLIFFFGLRYSNTHYSLSEGS